VCGVPKTVKGAIALTWSRCQAYESISWKCTSRSHLSGSITLVRSW